MHVLVFSGQALAVASRFERLSEESAKYSAEDQKLMVISEVPNLDDED